MAEIERAEPSEARFTLALGLPREQAWQRLTTEVDQWWPVAYRACSAGSRMRLDPVLGGALIEDSGHGNGVLWYTVQAVDAPSSLVLAGFVAPPFGGPALSLLRLVIEARDERNCVLEVHDSLVGRADPAAVEAGWREIFGGFARYRPSALSGQHLARPSSSQ